MSKDQAENLVRSNLPEKGYNRVLNPLPSTPNPETASLEDIKAQQEQMMHDLAAIEAIAHAIDAGLPMELRVRKIGDNQPIPHALRRTRPPVQFSWDEEKTVENTTIYTNSGPPYYLINSTIGAKTIRQRYHEVYNIRHIRGDGSWSGNYTLGLGNDSKPIFYLEMDYGVPTTMRFLWQGEPQAAWSDLKIPVDDPLNSTLKDFASNVYDESSYLRTDKEIEVDIQGLLLEHPTLNKLRFLRNGKTHETFPYHPEPNINGYILPGFEPGHVKTETYVEPNPQHIFYRGDLIAFTRRVLELRPTTRQEEN